MKKPLLISLITFTLFILSLVIFTPAHAATNVYNDEGELMMIIPDYMRDCRFWKIGVQHFFTGTEEQVRNFVGPTAPALNRGYCSTGNSYITHVLKKTPVVHMYRTEKQSEEMREFIRKENEEVFKTKQKENKVSSLLSQLEALGVSISIND